MLLWFPWALAVACECVRGTSGGRVWSCGLPSVLASACVCVCVCAPQAVVTRRKLIELAKAQTEEIEFLRGELEKLRQKTFPSFTTAAAESEKRGRVDQRK